MDSCVYQDVKYSWAHLAPMRISCASKEIGRDLSIAVAFANHCYTRGFDANSDKAEDILFMKAAKRDAVACFALCDTIYPRRCRKLLGLCLDKRCINRIAIVITFIASSSSMSARPMRFISCFSARPQRRREREPISG